MLHADPLSFFVGKDTVGALLASFQVVLKAGNREPDYLIPKVPFQSLNIATTLDLGKYRLNPGNALELTRTDGKNANFTTTGDIVAYSEGNYDLVSPIASASALGMIKVGEGLSISADGTLSSTGGGTNFTVGAGLSMGANKVLNVVYGTLAGTVCQGNDSRLSDARKNPNSLTVSYGSLPTDQTTFTYDGSAAQSIIIPNNFLTGVTWAMV